jgi:hypothetical protein
VTSGDLVCDSYVHEGTAYKYIYRASANSEARLALFYWPGWELRVDGKLQPGSVRLGMDGLVSVIFPAGSHHAEVRYNLSPEGQAARFVSVAAAGVWFAILVIGLFGIHRLRAITSNKTAL